MRPATRTWEDDAFARAAAKRRAERLREEAQRRRLGERTRNESVWEGGRRY